MTNSNNFAGQYVVKLPYLLAFSENIPNELPKRVFCGLPRVLSNVLKYFLILVPRDLWRLLVFRQQLPRVDGSTRRKASALLGESMVPKSYCLLARWLSRPDRSGQSALLSPAYAHNIEKTITIHNPSSSIIISSSFFSLLLLIILRGLHISSSSHIINDNKFKCNSKKI